MIHQLVFTDCKSGEGISPNRGFNTRGHSGLDAGLVALLEQQNLYKHYGFLAFEQAPEGAKKVARPWRPPGPHPVEPPPEVLAAFPTLCSYLRLPDGSYLATRARFCGTTNDGRPGNYFCHSLKLEPEDLVAARLSPAGLLSSSALLTGYAGPAKMSPISELPHPAREQSASLLLGEPYAAHAGAMLSSLIAAEGPATLVCLTNWNESLALVRDLTELLPPSAQARITFTTYETDPKWEIRDRGQGEVRVPAPRLIFAWPKAGPRVDILPATYKTQPVFNFRDHRFSENLSVHPFAEFALSCLRAGDIQALSRAHELIERAGEGLACDSWETYRHLSALGQGPYDASRLATALAGLSEGTVSAKAAGAVVSFTEPVVTQLASEARTAELSQLLAVLRPLAAAYPEVAGQLIGNCQSLAREALEGGHVRVAVTLLPVDHAPLLPLLRGHVLDLLGSSAVDVLNLSRSESELWLEVIGALFATSQTAQEQSLLLIEQLRMADKLGSLEAVWAQIQRGAISLVAKDVELRRQVLAKVSAQSYPSVHVDVLLATMDISDARDRQTLASMLVRCQDWRQPLTQLTSRCAQLDEASGREALLDLALTANRIVKELSGAKGEGVAAELCRAFQGTLPTAPQEFAEVVESLPLDVTHPLLQGEVIAKVLTNRGEQQMAWLDSLFAYQAPGLVDALAEAVARAASRDRDASNLALQVLARIGEDDSNAVGSLISSLIHAAELTAPDPQVLAVLERHVDRVDEGARRRVEMMRFVQRYAPGAEPPGVWPFPVDAPEWMAISALGAADQNAALEWCVRLHCENDGTFMGFLPVAGALQLPSAAKRILLGCFDDEKADAQVSILTDIAAQATAESASDYLWRALEWFYPSAQSKAQKALRRYLNELAQQGNQRAAELLVKLTPDAGDPASAGAGLMGAFTKAVSSFFRS